MFGLPDEFEYFECSACGCLQILEFPADMTKYYPGSYYSFSDGQPDALGGFRTALSTVRNRYYLTHRGPIGAVLHRWSPNETMRLIGKTNISRDARVLDVGCGSGEILRRLKLAGYGRVLGIDPFLPRDVCTPEGVELRKGSIYDQTESWDLIMYHHAFEHVRDPLEQLKCVAKLLDPGGTCLLRIPTVSSFAWQHYGAHWVQLDPPRHFFLHSDRSISIACAYAGLTCVRTEHDSDEFQFWGSEQVARGIPIESEKSYWRNRSGSMFSRREIKGFRERADALNRQHRGDQAAYFLRFAPGNNAE